MKSFLARVAIFFALLSILIGGMAGGMFWAESRAYYRAMKLNADDVYIAMGDSRMAQDLNPERFPGLTNRALTGSQLAVWEARLSDLVEANRSDGVARTVIVEMCPLQILGARKKRVNDWERDRAVLWYIHPELQKRAVFDHLAREFISSEFPGCFLSWLLKTLRGRPYESTLGGSFEAPYTSSGYTHDEIRKVVAEHREVWGSAKWTEEDFAPFEAMYRKITDVGWKMIVVTFPVYGMDSGREGLDVFCTIVADWCARHQVRYLDLTKGYEDVGLWIDGVHLRRQGAERLWAEAQDKIMEECK